MDLLAFEARIFNMSRNHFVFIFEKGIKRLDAHKLVFLEFAALLNKHQKIFNSSLDVDSGHMSTVTLLKYHLALKPVSILVLDVKLQTTMISSLVTLSRSSSETVDLHAKPHHLFLLNEQVLVRVLAHQGFRKGY